jgi:hypothetical protein
VVKQGTPVNIFYPDPAAAAAKKKTGDKKKDAAAAAAAAANKGGTGKADIVVPAVGGGLDVFAKKMGDLGIVPVPVKKFDDAPVGTPFDTVPPPGTKVKTGQHVQILVSAGEPQVIFSNGRDIKRADGRNGKLLKPIADGPADETDPTWSADASHVAFIANGRVMLKDLTKKNASAIPLTPATDKYSNLAWAPTADVNVLAMTKIGQSDDDLCLAQITKDPQITPQCISDPDFSAQRVVHWSTDGKTLLAFGLKNDLSAFGMVRWRLKSGKQAFSADPADWTHGHFITDLTQKGEGVIDAQVSPDGKKLALAANLGSGAFRLWIADDPKDFQLSSAVLTPVRACKLAWRGDSQELMVISGAANCGEGAGPLLRVPVNNVRAQKELNPSADDPVYQPFTLGG